MKNITKPVYYVGMEIANLLSFEAGQSSSYRAFDTLEQATEAAVERVRRDGKARGVVKVVRVVEPSQPPIAVRELTESAEGIEDLGVDTLQGEDGGDSDGVDEEDL